MGFEYSDYIIQDYFSAEEARNKSLVAVLANGGEPEQGEDYPTVVGIGVPRSKGGGGFSIVLNYTTYTFTSTGDANSREALKLNCVLRICTPKEGSASVTTRSTEVSYLGDNSEKLLNNIVAALERADNVETLIGGTVVSRRIINPKLQAFLEKFIADADNMPTLGLKDIIAAISSVKTSIEAQTAAQIVTLNRIATAIENLQPNPENNNQEGE